MLITEQTWKLKEEQRLLDIVDPELAEYPEDEVLRYIKIALFCTQAVSNQRPTMKQVVEMLSRNVSLKEELLTEPGVFRRNYSRQLAGGGASSSASSQVQKGKQAPDPQGASTQTSFHSASLILPR